MTLMLHSGANAVDYEALRAVVTPAPTESHVPIPHHEIVELMRFTLGFHQHEIAEEHHAVTEDGARYFGLMCLRSPYGEYTDMLGLRNSHDKSFRLSICCGLRVLVCENMAFSGDFTPGLGKAFGEFSHCRIASQCADKSTSGAHSNSRRLRRK